MAPVINIKQPTWEQTNILERAQVLPEDIAALIRLGMVDEYIAKLDALAIAKFTMKDLLRRYLDIRDQYNKVSDELEDAVLYFNNATGQSIQFDPNAPQALVLRKGTP